MPRDPRLDILFEPVQIGPKTLRNRFYAVPHSSGFGSERPEGQAAFRGMKAEGGWAAVCVEITSIDPESDRNPCPQPVRLWDDDDLGNLTAMVDAVHGHGALAGVELWHAGSAYDLNPNRLAAAGASAVPNDAYVLTTPVELDLAGIRRVQQAYVEAALRARSAGYDIVYVYGAHGYLPMQFLSPLTNRRDDAYGGSLENRARFWRETLEAVRDAVGDACAIAVRMGLDPTGRGGATVEEGAAFVRHVDHLVDLWDVNTSAIAEPWLDMRPSRIAAQGYQVEWSGRLREATAKPIVGVSRLTDPSLMAEIVRSGAWDLIGGARPSIADPFLPRKIEEGRLDEIRECIGCNTCIMRVGVADHIACTQNATAGDEFRRGWHPERFAPVSDPRRDVLVVGAGPAGLECATVLARRGVRRIHLVDEQAEPGGHLRWIAQLPGLGEWRRVVAYREGLLRRHRRQLELVPSTRLDVDQVLDYGADVVVVATGAAWAADGAGPFSRDGIPGAGLPHVLTPAAVVAGGPPTGARDVLVYDCEGHVTAASTALLLVERGHRVRFATPLGLAAPFLDRTFEGAYVREAFHRAGVAVEVATTLERIEAGGCTLATYGDAHDVAADAVVLATSRVPDDALWRSLAPRAASAGLPAFRIGDCAAPRLLADVIFDGHRLARELDADDPSRPLPFRRERRVLGAATAR